jgi:type I restriction enzyme S subunit
MRRKSSRPDWPSARLKDISTLYSGGTPPRKRAEFFRGETPWLTGQDIPEGYVSDISDSRDFVTEDAIKGSATRIVPADTVLVTTRVTVGKIGVTTRPVCFSQDVTGVIITSHEIALPRFVAHFLLSRRQSLLLRNQGSTIAGITRDSLASERIPLPPLSEQNRIVTLLEEAEHVRRLCIVAEQRTIALIPAIFRDLFGNPNENDKGFPRRKLSDLGDLDRGKSKHRPRDDSSLFGGPYPFIQTGDVAQSNGWIETYTQSYSEAGLKQSRLWPAGTLCITIAANIGATGILTFDACFPDSVVGFTPKDEVRPEYVMWWLRAYQSRLEAQAPAGAQKNINLSILNDIQVPVPPKSLQDQFHERLEIIRLSVKDVRSSGPKELALSPSLQAFAFTGQLTAGWRESHMDALQDEARARDQALKILSAAKPGWLVSDEIPVPVTRRTDGVYAELTRDQHAVLEAARNRNKGMDSSRLFTADVLAKNFNGPLQGHRHAIEVDLGVLAARGLVIAASREESAPMTGEIIYGNAYRLPMDELLPEVNDSREPVEGEGTRLRELQRLAGLLRGEPTQ